MNARFAEECRADPLELTKSELDIQRMSVLDGRQPKDICLKCEQDIVIGVFFDGTNNNKYRDTAGFSHSNVARLYEAFAGTPAKQTPPTLDPVVLPSGGKKERPVRQDKAFKGIVPAESFPFHRKIYVPGVGTPHPDVGDDSKGVKKSMGLAMALMGQVRLDWALLQLCNQIHAAVFGAPLLDSINLSKIANVGVKPSSWMPDSVEAKFRSLRQWLQDQVGQYDAAAVEILLADVVGRLDNALKSRGTAAPKLRKIRLSVFGFSRGAAEARAWVNLVLKRWGSRLAGIPLQIDFLGIFDTVASVGLAQSAALKGIEGHMAWAAGENMVVPEAVKRCVHLVAALELRGSFPLDSVSQAGTLPLNCKEIVYPGVHSDVGGGYPPDDQGRALGQGAEGNSRKISQITLAQMYREARMAGVPLAPLSAMDADVASYFTIDPKLREDFNAYVAATRSGHRPPANGMGHPAVARMFPTETQPAESLLPLIRRHAGYLLQWRRHMLKTPGRIAELPGLKAMTADTKWQDAQDFREAEQELQKELVFLNSSDPDKFNHVDDPTLDLILDYANKTRVAGSAVGLVPMVGPYLIPLTVGSGQALYSQVRQAAANAMHEKQRQWDTWLNAAWHGTQGTALPSDKAQAAYTLFEQYVHDSRAWFKPMMTSDGQGVAPSDDDWFSQGGREKARKERKAKLAEARNEAVKKGDGAAVAQIDAQLKELDKEGQPFIHGGREPYRMWGYLRHRGIYMSGNLTPAQTQAIEKANEVTDRELTRNELLADEDAYHKQRMADIRKRREEVWADQRLSLQDRQQYWDGADTQMRFELDRHAKAINEINRKYGSETTAAAH